MVYKKGPQISKLTPGFSASFQGAGSSVRELNKRECKKGGLIAFQPPQSESHCLSTSMTEQPFLRLIPLSIRENLGCQKKCRLLEGRLLTFDIPRGAGVLVGMSGGIPPISHELQMGVSAFEGIDMRIMPAPALAGRSCNGRTLCGPESADTSIACASWLHHTPGYSHIRADRLRLVARHRCGC